MRYRQLFSNYSEEAIQQVIEQSIGKPCNDEDGFPIGTIVKAERIRNDIIEFEVEVF